MNTQTTADVVVTRDGPVVLATLNRPEKYNAVRAQTFAEIIELLTWTAADSDVRAIVFTGAGKAFCSGQDLDELDVQISGQMSLQQQRDTLNQFQAITKLQIDHPKVLIAALNGVAVGFGAELALGCDLRVAGPEAKIGFVEVKRALFETNGVTFLLPRLIGHGRAAEMLLTGEMMAATEAHRIGLVNRLASHSAVDDALALAHKVGMNAPISLAWVKRSLRMTWENSIHAMMDFEIDGMLASLASEDLREGIASFTERRPPRYQGR
jgi:enoyl-CoA hydratase/carnithine racemase